MSSGEMLSPMQEGRKTGLSSSTSTKSQKEALSPLRESYTTYHSTLHSNRTNDFTGGKEEREGREQETEESLSFSLNPMSSVFQPFSSPVQTVSDLSQLALSDKAPSSSSQPAKAPAYGEPGDHWRNKHEEGLATYTSPLSSTAYSIRTPATHSLPSTFSLHTPLSTGPSNTPYTPTTPYRPSVVGSKKPDQYKFAAEQLESQLPQTYSEGLEEAGRYLLITGIPRHVTAENIRDMIIKIADFKAIIAKHLRSKSHVIVAFHDSRHAAKVYKALHDHPVVFEPLGREVTLHCMKIETEAVKQTTGEGPEWADVWSASEAKVVIQVLGGREVSLRNMQNCLATIGELQWLQQVGHTSRIYLAEFFDTRDAAVAIELLHDKPVGDARLLAAYYSQYQASRLSASCGGEDNQSILPSGPCPPATTAADPVFTLGSAAYQPGSFGRAFQKNVSSPTTVGWPGRATPITLPSDLQHSDTSGYYGGITPASAKHTSVPAAFGRPGSHHQMHDSATAYQPPAHLVAMSRRMSEPGAVQGLVSRADITARRLAGQGIGGPWRFGDRQAIPEENRVFPERILAGLDSRTTVMVKDVPNKLSRQGLVDILNEVVPGGFDFVYLRFDFSNCCNVGYAFVNFTTVKSLYEFIQARVGKKWNLFSSEKVLQVSYANIQGKAALINKFRNSAVMGVIEQWRPQIFYSSGSMQGMSEPFPESDNYAQKFRSQSARLSTSSGLHDDYAPCGDADSYQWANAGLDTAYGF